jgi:hypothetical protein
MTETIADSPHVSDESAKTTTTPECAPWCDCKDNAGFSRQGICFGDDLRTPLSIDQTRHGDLDEGEQDYVVVYAVRRPGQPDTVNIGHNDEAGIEFTPDEAREVIEHMQLVLGQIEGPRAAARGADGDGKGVQNVHTLGGVHPGWCVGDNRGAYVLGAHDHVGASTGWVTAEMFEPMPVMLATTVTVYPTAYAGMPGGVETHVFNESDNGLYVDTTFILKPDEVDALIAALSAAAAQVRAWDTAAAR